MKTLLFFLLAFLAIPLRGFSALFGPPRISCANGMDPVPHADGRVGYEASEAILAAHLLLTPDGTGGVEICEAGDEPLGNAFGITDVGGRVAVTMLGATPGTRTFISSKAIAANTRIYSNAAGKVSDAATAGNFLVGRSITSTSGADQEIEATPAFPLEV